QQVLNLGIKECFDYLYNAIASLLSEYQISYIKWDYNRDILEGGSRLTGRPAYRDHALALYALLDKLRAQFPHLEIESCSSGGGR
ncbi:alpha-galactosidase, partial [Streptococcus agalactiae]